ncbi:MAG: serine/threonine protein kinase [Polaromonas sp.]|nr:serine/threonine protein kinase [Polaromonas sp.]
MTPLQDPDPLPAPTLLEQLRAGTLAGSRRLSLSCGLENFPPEIFTLADTLEILDLSGNALSALPDDLARLHRLRIIFCSDNRFTELPAVLGTCAQLEMIGFRANQIRRVPGAALPPRLRALVLTDNQIAELPAALGRCARLQKLMLAGNRLQSLPPEMAACTRLELLRIAANRFTALPGWLLALPRLAWLAFAGNPLSVAGEAAAQAGDLARIDWASLRPGALLGEGASGVIRQALWQRGDIAQPVAVKLFKGALTSDGLPRHEMAACLGAGAHPGLIAVHGRITGHPAGSDGLVMALVAPRFGSLAAPPSLDSCTRDVYAAATRFTPDAALRLARDVASAAAQLHARGILHGDLYAHNILCAAGGQALLGDFGAASFFPPDDAPLARALQRIEARAFSCLLEELLACCPAPVSAHPALALLADLQADCAREDTGRRPLFADIVQRLLN